MTSPHIGTRNNHPVLISNMKHVIAIVDDDPGVLRGLKGLLNAHGYSVRLYSSGLEFLNDRLQGVACAVLDVNMEPITGVETRRRLSSIHPEMPVIFMTGQDSLNVRQSAQKVGCASYLCKPITAKLLIEAIQQAVAD